MNSNDIGIAEARNRLRENAQNEATCIALNDMLKDAQEEVRRLREENERLRKDAERIDWISRQDFDALCLSLVLDAPHAGEYYVCGDNNDDGYGLTFRDAIDAARGAK